MSHVSTLQRVLADTRLTEHGKDARLPGTRRSDQRSEARTLLIASMQHVAKVLHGARTGARRKGPGHVLVGLTEWHGRAPMSDGTQILWSATGDVTRKPPVVMLHGGPGLPDYLRDVAEMVSDIAPVYRYCQRGTGGSPWQGHHTLARHVSDLAELLEVWDTSKAIVIGHSYGAGLASRFCLAHPEKVAALLLMCGPFVGDWRTVDRAERDRRMTAAQRDRYQELELLPSRTADEEAELLTLAWFTDHADPERGWALAAQSAQQRRPVNWSMNRDLGADSRSDPLDEHVDELRARLPAHAEIIGGSCDPRPLSALASLGERLSAPLTSIDGAGHEPWLEQPEVVRTNLRRFVRSVEFD